MYHICAITSLRWQILGGNSRYSCKLDSEIFFGALVSSLQNITNIDEFVNMAETCQ